MAYILFLSLRFTSINLSVEKIMLRMNILMMIDEIRKNVLTMEDSNASCLYLRFVLWTVLVMYQELEWELDRNVTVNQIDDRHHPNIFNIFDLS